MNLTAQNGSKVIVDREKLQSLGPHIDGGTVIQVGRNAIHVKETVKEILQLRE
jgi:hypothetical protein